MLSLGIAFTLRVIFAQRCQLCSGTPQALLLDLLCAFRHHLHHGCRLHSQRASHLQQLPPRLYSTLSLAPGKGQVCSCGALSWPCRWSGSILSAHVTHHHTVSACLSAHVTPRHSPHVTREPFSLLGPARICAEHDACTGRGPAQQSCSFWREAATGRAAT